MKKRVLVCLASAALAAAAFADGLPAGYTEVPYLKLNGQCRVKTGLTPTSTDIVEMSWRPSTVSGNQNLWCSRISGTQQFTVFMIGNKVRFDRNGAQVTSAETIAAATDYTIVANYGTLAGSVTKTGTDEAVTSVTMTSGDYTPGSELCIFASHDASVDAGLNNFGSYRFYSFKLKASNGTVKCDLVPAKRDSDGTLGVYDVKRSLFLENDLTGAFTTAGMTITPSDPQWGAALSVSDELTIDAGDGRLWAGSITVRSGGTLRTRGNLTVSGATALNAGGALDVETGNAYFAFAGSSVVGAVTVRAGAELKMSASEAFHGDATASLDLYGTLNVAGTRQRLDNLAFVRFRDGSRVIGSGDGNGGLDFGCTAKNRIVVEGAVLVDTPVKCRTGQTLQVACFDGATVGFPRGFLYGGAGNGKGNMEQVAATAEEGNTGGTCAGARIEVGHSNFQGKMTFISKGVVTLVSASQSYSVDVNSGEVEFRAESALDDGSHAIVKALPAVTAANGAAVRLSSGGGVIALRDAAPAFPLVFDGATLQIAADAPVALAAGSTAASATVVGVEGLAANTAATLFTGADSSFDVSKISVSAMHNGVAIGTPAATSLSGADVVTAGVAAYDAAAWIEPYIKATALIWLDASDAANFVFKDNTFGLVETWKDKSAYGRDASYYTSPAPDKYVRNYGTYGISAGVPAFLMGTTGSDIDLKYARMTNMRSIFWVMAIEQNGGAWFLGDSGQYRFHRTSTLAYAYDNANVYFKNGSIYCDGVKAADPISDIPPTDRHVYSTVNASNNMESDYLTSDVRDASNAHNRSGGRDISELIAFSTVLSDADREAIEAYLMAKWMGANPSAAQSDASSYKFTGDYEIDDFVGGDKNLQFAEGASVSISNPSSSAPMLSTTGAVTLPAGSPLAVNVDAQSLPPGTYTVMQAASGITSLSQFAPTATVGNGAAATFAVVDGKLTMTIAVSSSVASQTWRPASSADLGWNTTSANWLYDGGATGGFIPYVPAFIDGAESATGDITVDGEMFAGPITLTGANDYTFTGAGTLKGGDTVTLGGTGTVTLNGASFDDQTIVITNEQKVVLGFNASEHALGKNSGSTGGKVEIRAGGQFNVNSLNTAGNDTDARFEITQIKTFVIAGDGPDGRGAIVDDCLDGRTTHESAWGPVLRRVELSDDATIGGADRFDVRVRAGTSATAVGGIYGPGKNLTIKTTGWFGLINLPIDVESVLVTGGGTWRPEAMAETNFKIPGGITLDNGTLHGYGSTYPATIAFNVEAGGATISSQNGTTTIKGPLTVKDGSSLTLNGSYTTTLSGAITNNGVIEATAGTMNFNGALENNGTIRHSGGNAYFAGPLNGTAEIEHTGGETYLANGFVSGDLDVSMSGSGHVFLKEGMRAGVITVNMTGGVSGFFPGSGTAPQFTEFNINKVSGTPGLDIRPQATGMMDVSGKVNANFGGEGTIYVYGAARDGEYGMALNLSGSVDTLIVGYDASHGGDLRLKAGSDLTAKKVYTGYNGSGTAHGRIVIDAGAKLTATSELFMGRYSGSPSTMAVQTMDVSGTLDAAGITFFSAYDTPRDETYLRAGGLMKVNGITLNRQASGASTYNWWYGNGVGAAEGRHWFLMEGGRIEMGTGGFNGARIPGVTKVDLQNGELVNVKGEWGGANGFPVFFGYEKLGGKVTFDLDEFFVNWNQALSGASDLTIKGSANLQGTRNDARMQGAMLGKVTVENTAGNDLRVTSAFCGGLTLTNGVNAEVAKYSDERYPFAVAGQVYDSLTVTPWSYPCASANFWNFTKTNYSSNPFGSYSSTAGRGKFYVPAEKAGVWSFCGQCDDWVRLDIDGTQVMKSSGKCVVASGQATLTEGWHTFTVAQQDYTGGSGPSNASGFKNRMAFGFIIGESTSTDGNAYTPFLPGADLGDGLTLQVQPLVNACVWSWQNGNGSWNTTENWSHIKCLDSVEYMHRYGNSGTDATGYFNNKKVSRFQGWFKVEENQGGEWSFDMHYDDYKMLVIDGATLINVGSWGGPTNVKTTLAPGWHRWEVRVGDNTGGYGPNNNENNYWTLSYVAPDDPAEKQWIETNLKLAATLGDIAVLEPSGIYRDLELGEGSTLTSSGTMAMPIFGTLKGTGTLAGAFEFAGGSSCWEVEGKGNRRELAKAVFAAPTGATFRGLGKVKATFDGRPVCGTYLLAEGVADVSQEDVAGVAVEVMDGDRDYSEKFSLVVQGASLLLKNASPGGMTLYVR